MGHGWEGHGEQVRAHRSTSVSLEAATSSRTPHPGSSAGCVQPNTAQRRLKEPRVLLDLPWPCAFMGPGDGPEEGMGEGRAQGKEHRRAEGDWGPHPPRSCAPRSPPGPFMALAGVEVGSSWKEAASTSSSSRSVRLYTSSRSMSRGLKSLVSTPGRGTRIPPRLGCASCCQWWSVTEPGRGDTGVQRGLDRNTGPFWHPQGSTKPPRIPHLPAASRSAACPAGN